MPYVVLYAKLSYGTPLLVTKRYFLLVDMAHNSLHFFPLKYLIYYSCNIMHNVDLSKQLTENRKGLSIPAVSTVWQMTVVPHLCGLGFEYNSRQPVGQ